MTQNLITSMKISDTTRWLLIAVYDGDKRTLPYLYQIANLFQVDEVCRWLISNKLTGAKFLGWMNEEHEGSLLKTMSFVLMKVKKELVMKDLFYGKDIRI